MNELVTIPQTNAEVYRASTDAAAICKEIVKASVNEIQGRKYVKVEGWQAIAIAHGCVAASRDVERIEGGVRAIGEVRRMSDGQLLSQAEGFVGEDEATWFGGETTDRWGKTKTMPKRSDYAIRAMAQTRAISRACRSAFAHVVVMMNEGLSTTPAEEVSFDGFHDAAPSAQEGPTRAGEVKRLTSARAKEIRLDKKLWDLVADAKTDEALDIIDSQFDTLTAEYPLSWLDSARNHILNRRAELKTERMHGAMDAEYKAVVA